MLIFLFLHVRVVDVFYGVMIDSPLWKPFCCVGGCGCGCEGGERPLRLLRSTPRSGHT